jgi:hypothetical protein
MTTTTKRAGTVGARWLVSALAIAGTLAAWVGLAAQTPKQPDETIVVSDDANDPLPMPSLDVSTSASRGRR